MTVHRAALDGFSTSAGAYARGRPGYPAEALSWLREVLRLGPGRTVLEVGAGTGKFLTPLLDTGAEVVALEPIDAMRAEITARFVTVPTLDGTADHIGLPDASVDAVVCAQSFHWFASSEAVVEMRRVLKPGGVLGLIWNRRDTTVPWVGEIDAIIDPHDDGAPRHQSGQWREVFPANGFVSLGERHATHLHTGTPERVILDRVLSISFVAALPVAPLAEVAARLRTLIQETPDLAGRAEISLPYDTLMVAFQKAAD